MRGAIADKGYKYHDLKEAGFPFITVIATVDPLIDASCFFDALYGDEAVTMTFEKDESYGIGKILGISEPYLNDAGSFTPKAKGRLVNTTVSAAWFIRLASIDPVAISVVTAMNPWGRNRFDWNDPRLGVIEYLETEEGATLQKSFDRPPLQLEPGSGS